MKLFSLDRLPLFVLASGLLAAGATAQTQAVPQTDSQYTGVSQPPADDTITTSEDQPAAKPSPYVAPPAAQPKPQAAAAAPATAAVPATNPDYDVVSSVPANEPASAPAQMPVHLVSRPADPSDGIVQVVPAGANQLAEGTNISVRMLTPLNTTTTQKGEPFRAQIAADVYKDGRVVIPVGAELRGRVTDVSQGHRVGMHATIRLRPDYVLLPDGTAYHLTAEVISSSAPGTHVDDEGGIQASYHVAKDMAEYGGGAGGGALVGAALGGPVAAGAGAVVGAGMVTTHMLLQKPAQAKLEQGEGVVFSLSEPMDLVPTRN